MGRDPPAGRGSRARKTKGRANSEASAPRGSRHGVDWNSWGALERSKRGRRAWCERGDSNTPFWFTVGPVYGLPVDFGRALDPFLDPLGTLKGSTLSSSAGVWTYAFSPAAAHAFVQSFQGRNWKPL